MVIANADDLVTYGKPRGAERGIRTHLSSLLDALRDLEVAP